MSSRETRLGLLAVAGVVVALPFAVGCGGGKFVAGGESGSFDPDANARVAYIATEGSDADGIKNEEVATGTASATITADAQSASYDPDTGDIQGQTNLPAGQGGIYGDAQSSIYRQQTAVSDQGDTFLTYHEVKDGTRTELSRGYTGTRSDASTVADLRSATNHTATYTGTGSALVGQGDDPKFSYYVDGNMTMNATFAGQTPGISGRIVDTTVTAPTQYNPNGVNTVLFSGSFIDDSPDYEINDIRLNQNTNEIAVIDNGGGVGSFFGSHAGGTMGVFAGTGGTTDEHPSPVKVIGSFQGTTADNDPVQ
jgi:hypothetical protein